MNEVVPLRTPEPLRPVTYNNQQLALIRRTVAKDTTPDEFDLFVEVCKRVGLDPFRRQIHCLVFSKDDPKKRQTAYITGIDGYRAIAARNGDYRPDEERPNIVMDEALKDSETNPLGIDYAEVTVYKRDPSGQWFPIKGVATWEEFAPIAEEWEWVDTGETWSDSGKPKRERRPTGKRKLNKENWRRMPRVMIAKCAEAQALRRGWPEDLGGLYAEEEMAQAEAADLTASEAAEAAETERRLLLTKTKDTVPIFWRAGEPIEFIPVGMVADRILEFVRESDSATEIETWLGTNREGLRQFWALAKGDAVEVKRKIEERLANLAGETTGEPEQLL